MLPSPSLKGLTFRMEIELLEMLIPFGEKQAKEISEKSRKKEISFLVFPRLDEA